MSERNKFDSPQGIFLCAIYCVERTNEEEEDKKKGMRYLLGGENKERSNEEEEDKKKGRY
jgi:hypothetical protein